MLSSRPETDSALAEVIVPWTEVLTQWSDRWRAPPLPRHAVQLFRLPCLTTELSQIEDPSADCRLHPKVGAGSTTRTRTPPNLRHPEPNPEMSCDELMARALVRSRGRLAPARVTPDWLPDWADPTDPSSDMRRWIMPFVLSPFLASQLLRVAVFDPVLERELDRRSPLFALRSEQEEQARRQMNDK